MDSSGEMLLVSGLWLWFSFPPPIAIFFLAVKRMRQQAWDGKELAFQSRPSQSVDAPSGSTGASPMSIQHSLPDLQLPTPETLCGVFFLGGGACFQFCE